MDGTVAQDQEEREGHACCRGEPQSRVSSSIICEACIGTCYIHSPNQTPYTDPLSLSPFSFPLSPFRFSPQWLCLLARVCRNEKIYTRERTRTSRISSPQNHFRVQMHESLQNQRFVQCAFIRAACNFFGRHLCFLSLQYIIYMNI